MVKSTRMLAKRYTPCIPCQALHLPFKTRGGLHAGIQLKYELRDHICSSHPAPCKGLHASSCAILKTAVTNSS